MKKILLLLLAFVSIQVYSQRTGTVEFDFSNPETLHGSGNFTVPTDPGETLINYYTFTEGQVSLSFSTAGNGCAINCIHDYEKNTNSYTLVVRGHGEMIIKIQGKGYALQTVKFDGAIGNLDNVNSAFKRWDASTDSETEIRFRNGTQHTAIRKLIVTYTRPAEDVILRSSKPNANKAVPSFSEMSLNFNLPVNIENPDGFTLYKLDENRNQISNTKKSLEASVSPGSDGSVLILKSPELIQEDGNYEVVIQPNALRNVDNSLNSKMSVFFTIEIERNTLNYTSINPEPHDESIPELPETIILSFGQNVSLDRNKAIDAVLHKENTNKYIQVYLNAKGSDVQITYNNDGALTEPGRWILTIPEGAITNGSSSPKNLFFNPTYNFVYTIENELSIMQKLAEALFANSGGDQVHVGYPVKGSNGRKMLESILSSDKQPSVEDYNDAIDAFCNEVNVLLPQPEKWYKIAGVHDGDTLYLKHQDGRISLTRDVQSASAFKTKVTENGSKVFAFMIGHSDNYLHIGELGSNGHNLSVLSNIPQFSLSKFSIIGKNIAGLLKMEIEGGKSANIQFEDGLSAGFMFVEASEEDNLLKPLAKLSSTTIDNSGENLFLTILNVGNMKIADSTKPYFMKDNQPISYRSDVLIATNDSTKFQVNIDGLPLGVYTLVVPAGTFEYTNKKLAVKDETHTLAFEIKGNIVDGRPNFDYSYSYNVLQYISKNVNNMTSPDINDITLFAYVPDEYSDMIPDPTKTVEILKSRTLSVVATGHFEVYQDKDALAQYNIKGVKAIRLKLDKPFVLGDLKNDPGQYLCYIPEATFGDANFGKYLEDPTSVRPEDCIVNCASSSFQFMIDDANALNTPTKETFELAKKLSETYGVGYPSKNSVARKALDAKIDYVQGGEEVYQNIIKNFYAEKDVEMPAEETYYRVTAISDKNDKAYLTYDGLDVGLTNDINKATGFKAVANEDGIFLLQTGDGRYFKQISEAGNVSVTPSSANNITLAKFAIESMEAKSTFGMLSIKAENQYMSVDISKLAFLNPSDKPDNFDVEHTNAFILEVIDKSQISAPSVSMNFSIAYGENVESLKTMVLTFKGASKVDLADKSEIMLNSETAQNVGKIEVIPMPDKGNEFILSFSELPESPSFTLLISKGAFTFTFADVVHEIKGGSTLIKIGTTGISGIYVDESDEPVYDLQGRKVSGVLKSGIYIKNGKKVYIK